MKILFTLVALFILPLLCGQVLGYWDLSDCEDADDTTWCIEESDLFVDCSYSCGEDDCSGGYTLYIEDRTNPIRFANCNKGTLGNELVIAPSPTDRNHIDDDGVVRVKFTPQSEEPINQYGLFFHYKNKHIILDGEIGGTYGLIVEVQDHTTAKSVSGIYLSDHAGLGEFTDNIEIKHVEIDGSGEVSAVFGTGGSTGIHVCNRGCNVEHYPENISINHCYIHDWRNDGCYFGCGGLDWGHLYRKNYSFCDNIVKDVGSQCMQFKNVADGLIADNILINCATLTSSWWRQGISVYQPDSQVDAGNVTIERNKIIGVAIGKDDGAGIQLQVRLPCTVQNNVIVNVPLYGINSWWSRGHNIRFNTIVDAGTEVHISGTTDFITGNIVADTGSNGEISGGVQSDNWIGSVASAYFNSPGYPNYDYSLTSSTPGTIINQITNGYPDADFLNNLRDDGAADIGAYEYIATTCIEDWACTNWMCSACVDGQQDCTRICTDDNECGTEDNKPSDAETRACGTGELVGYWSMNSSDISGGTVLDMSGFGNHGIIHGAVSTTGRVGEALFFDGEDDYVEANGDSLNITDDITIAAWVYPDDVSRFSYIAAKPHDSAAYPWLMYGLRTHSDTERFSFSLASGGTQYSVLAATTANVGQWYHVAGTYSSSTGYMSIYINGSLSDTINVAAGQIDTNNQPLQIGRHQFESTTLFNGTLDEIMIWNRSLSTQEILEMYDSSFHAADDNPKDGCVEEHELIPFIDLWRYDSTANPMGEVMEAVTLWSRGTGCVS